MIKKSFADSKSFVLFFLDLMKPRRVFVCYFSMNKYKQIASILHRHTEFEIISSPPRREEKDFAALQLGS